VFFGWLGRWFSRSPKTATTEISPLESTIRERATPVTGSQFVAAYADKGFSAWERAAVELAKSGGLVDWPLVPVTVVDGPHILVYFVASDVLSVGTPEDFVRLPLTPRVAQEIANLKGMLLPTPLMDYQIWRASSVKLERLPMVPNKYADLRQYADHSRRIDAQINRRSGLVSGHKKDIVVSSLLRPGKVIIHGWYKPGPDVFDDRSPWTTPDRQPQQVHSDAHGADYVDYSHGVRLVAPIVTIDGVNHNLENVLRDSRLAPLLSHEGAIKTVRYQAPLFPSVLQAPDRLADIGLDSILSLWRKAG
jgi:hypothetical protein